ncbi:3-deoxy-manno-octulosonate cytidylyltransferase [Halobacillus faecis]
MDFCIIIPARYQSSRLPGKPLVDLGGLPMIVRTYNQCIQACSPDKVFVATDDERIQKVCESYNIQTLLTSEECLTGTDRVAEAATLVKADVYINVQGDEPLINPQDIKTIIKEVKKRPGDILNGYCPITTENEFRNYSIPKVVFREDQRLLYMSRAPIPATKKASFKRSWRQVCIYSFPRESLLAFKKSQQKSALEEIEDIEILRFLEMGWDVKMVKLSDQSIAVDNPEDIKRVEDVLDISEKKFDAKKNDKKDE